MNALVFRWKINSHLHMRNDVMTATTFLCNDEGLEILDTHFLQLYPMFGFFILGVDYQFDSPRIMPLGNPLLGLRLGLNLVKTQFGQVQFIIYVHFVY